MLLFLISIYRFWARVTSFHPLPVELPGGLALPTVISPNEQLKAVVDVLFNIGATAFLLGLALHLFGAFKNHLVLKNRALRRMLGKQVEL